MTRNTWLATAVSVALVTIGGSWAAAGALHPAHAAAASNGRVLEVRYEVQREPPYVPPPPSEATRLDVLDATAATTVDDGVLSAQTAGAFRILQAEDEARTAAALAAVRTPNADPDGAAPAPPTPSAAAGV